MLSFYKLKRTDNIKDLEREVENLEDTCSKDTDLEDKLEDIEFILDRNEVVEEELSYKRYEELISAIRNILND